MSEIQPSEAYFSAKTGPLNSESACCPLHYAPKKAREKC
jgi:hypothetical protein